MRNKAEYDMQCKFVKYAQLKYPDLLMTISPAGLITSVGLAMKIKAMGYKKGTPDIMIFEPRKEYYGYMIEFKSVTGTPSDEQVKFLDQAQRLGYKTDIFYNAEAACKALDNYMTKAW